jgi:hypothetical protein
MSETPDPSLSVSDVKRRPSRVPRRAAPAVAALSISTLVLRTELRDLGQILRALAAFSVKRELRESCSRASRTAGRVLVAAFESDRFGRKTSL